jgi:branched-chain amino acid transport system substrate-binding protein
MQHGTKRCVVAAAAIGLVGALSLAAVPGAGAVDETAGVTPNSVSIGFIYSKTGIASSTFADSDAGCRAIVGQQNAAGGVNGRKIDVQYEDDQSANNLTVAQDLVQNQNVFALVNNSALAFLAYRWVLDNGIPEVGGGFDGSYYGDPATAKEIVSALGNTINADGVAYDTLPKVMKKQGATKIAALAYGISASSANAAKNLQKYAVPAAGLKAVYTNTSVDFGTTDVGPLVLGIKNSGANGVYLPMVADTNLAVVTGLQQNGVPMKSIVMATGYGQALLDQPAAQTLRSNVLFQTNLAPVELKTKATKQFQSDLAKYANYTGVPDFGIYTGYVSCDLMIRGLENAGASPTRDGFVAGMHQVGAFDQAGLACQPVDISLKGVGHSSPTGCTWYVQIKNGKFVPYPANGQPIRGKLIEQSTVTTTTTTPPAG